jgi:hypothetical protein
MADAADNTTDVAPTDNARCLTDGLVYTTAALLLIAFIMMEKALAQWFNAGMFAN